MQVKLVNENSLIIYFAESVSIETADFINYVYHRLNEDLGDVIENIIPSYTSILLSCHSRKIGLQAFLRLVNSALNNLHSSQIDDFKPEQIELPVYYGEEVALDHEDISQHTGIPFSEIIKLHTSEYYRVFAIGFAPGFAFLGNVPTQIAMPRKKSPRTNVPKGSVAIADRQTAVYPNQSPGGWQIIGRTPINLLDITTKNLSKFSMGDQVKFKAIDKQTFLAMGGVL